MFKSYLSVNNLSYLISDFQMLFEDVSFDVSGAQKVAIVGENGVGKTTLLKLICGELVPAKGEIVVNGVICFLPQNLSEQTGSVAEVLEVQEMLCSLRRIEEAKATEKDFEVVEGHWDIEEKIKEEFERWHLSHLDINQKFSTLSGGEREKIMLIKSFISAAEILIFDEPTNNLDLVSSQNFLEELQRSKKLILIVSHDRKLLNKMEVILELSKNNIQKFTGNYDFYVEEKKKQRALAEEKIVALKEERKNTLKTQIENQIKADKSAKSGKAKVSSSKYSSLQAGDMSGRSVVSNAKKKGKLESDLQKTSQTLRNLEMSVSEENIKIPLPQKPFIKNKLVEIKNLSFSYENRKIFEGFNLFVGGKDRTSLQGNNGSGKTTLLKLILQELSPQKGEVKCYATVAYLNQNLDILDKEKTILENIQRLNPEISLNEAYAILANFKFRNEQAHKKVAVLSGGEILRVCLASILGTQKQPELLILDEPTNNLDLKSVKILEEAILQYQGATIVVSHDEMFLRNIGINRNIKL